MKLHVVTGLPRAGSTLLCNLLNQNPRFWATTTSILPQIVGAVSSVLSHSIEFKAMLDRRKKETNERVAQSMRAFVTEWHKVHDRPVIFDKSRGWPFQALLLRQLFPQAKLLVLVRDLKTIFSSCEKQHQRTALYDEAQKPIGKTVLARYQHMFGAEGLIGGPLNGVMDLVRRDQKNVLFIRYEEFASDPQGTMARVYGHLGEEEFEHEFDDVKNTSEDPDGLYMYKFPHTGSGKIEPPDLQEWVEFVPRDIVKDIANNAAFFNDTFGYV